MKLRFEVDQAECFRRGINCDKSIITVEVDPKDLEQNIRNLIADRLHGIDVCAIDRNGMIIFQIPNLPDRPVRILANEPTFESLIEAIKESELRNTIHFKTLLNPPSSERDHSVNEHTS